jgi:hypothetical protein
MIAIVIGIVLVVWSVWGYFASRAEQVVYRVVRKVHGYEVRLYESRIVAQTKVEGEYRQSMSVGFRILARYIFGGNSKRESIAMTVPVTSEARTSEKIAMTAPVTVGGEGEAHVVSFSMPSSYTMATLPAPLDTRITILEVPKQTMAAIVFAGYRTERRIQKMKDTLLAKLQKDGVSVKGTPVYAGYSGPGTPPWMTRNEVMVEIVEE